MSLELVIVGDEAWTREELAEDEQYRVLRRAHDRRRYRENATRRASVKASVQKWQDEHRPRMVGSLHDLACTGPTIPTGCVCAKRGTSKIRCYDKPR